MQHISGTPDYDISRLTIVKPRHCGRWLAAAAILAILLFVVKAFADGQIAWIGVGQFFTAPVLMRGLDK
ncbi:MAG: hypothetical protein VW600_07970 [Ferrovibrio sp.]